MIKLQSKFAFNFISRRYTEAIAPTGEAQDPIPKLEGALGSLAIVPGPAGGEGCSSEGTAW
jgi:hypothetical protein